MKSVTVNLYYTGRNGSARAFVNEMTESGIVDAGGFRNVSLWTTGDARPDRADEKWVNLLCRAD